VRSEAEAALAEVEAARLDAEAVVRTAWLDMTAAETARAAARAASAAAQSAYEVIELRVRNQKSILVEQLDALAALRKAQLDEAQALFDEAMAAVRIERAVGRH
jgi:outer membrane protein TolC